MRYTATRACAAECGYSDGGEEGDNAETKQPPQKQKQAKTREKGTTNYLQMNDEKGPGVRIGYSEQLFGRARVGKGKLEVGSDSGRVRI